MGSKSLRTATPTMAPAIKVGAFPSPRRSKEGEGWPQVRVLFLDTSSFLIGESTDFGVGENEFIGFYKVSNNLSSLFWLW